MNDLKKMEDLENDLNSDTDLSTKLDTDLSSDESVIEPFNGDSSIVFYPNDCQGKKIPVPPS